MENNLAYLSLGSNIGDRVQNLKTALEEIKKLGTITEISSFYETEPVDYKEQPEFLNNAIALKTDLSAVDLIIQLQEIEHKMGRVKEIDKGPRNIDIDIILFNQEIINQPNLQIPHSKFSSRNFVLTPMEEIAPEVQDPISKKTIKQLHKELNHPEKVKLWI